MKNHSLHTYPYVQTTLSCAFDMVFSELYIHATKVKAITMSIKSEDLPFMDLGLIGDPSHKASGNSLMVQFQWAPKSRPRFWWWNFHFLLVGKHVCQRPLCLDPAFWRFKLPSRCCGHIDAYIISIYIYIIAHTHIYLYVYIYIYICPSCIFSLGWNLPNCAPCFSAQP